MSLVISEAPPAKSATDWERLVAGLGASGDAIQNAASEAEKSGAAIGTAIGAGIIIIVWAAGAVILGLLVLLTPGKTIITETRKD